MRQARYTEGGVFVVDGIKLSFKILEDFSSYKEELPRIFYTINEEHG